MSAATMRVELCGACGEEPLTCGECGEAFCPCGIKNDPEGIWELCRDLARCRDCVVEPALEIVRSWGLVPREVRDLALREMKTARDFHRRMRRTL